MERLREKGRIKDDYPGTEQFQACFQELLDCLDRDSPDKIRFDFVKSVFLAAAMETRTDKDSILPQQLTSLARKLTGGEILVLAATYEISKLQSDATARTSAGEWLAAIAQKSGLKHNHLVELHEDGLIEKKLLTRRQHADRSGVTPGKHYRLTDLGVSLCDFVSTYEPVRAFQE